jgi:hypothetical protein
MVGNGFGRWKTIPIWRRTSTGSTSGPYSDCPSIITLPSTRAPGITSCIRFSDRRNVDLPQPDGPISAVTERAGIVIETPSTARKSP